MLDTQVMDQPPVPRGSTPMPSLQQTQKQAHDKADMDYLHRIASVDNNANSDKYSSVGGASQDRRGYGLRRPVSQNKPDFRSNRENQQSPLRNRSQQQVWGRNDWPQKVTNQQPDNFKNVQSQAQIIEKLLLKNKKL